MSARVELVTPSEQETGTNTWVVGDDEEVVVIDAGHDAARIMSAVGDREVLAVVCTHGLRGHVGAAVGVAERDEAPIALHPQDRVLWDLVHPDRRPDIEVEDGGVFEVAGERLEVMHTPGHTPGGVSLHAAGPEVVLSGGTLGKSGPGSAQGPHSDFPTLLTSIGEQLLTLPGHTRVCPAHGEETTVEEQDSDFDSWIGEGES